MGFSIRKCTSEDATQFKEISITTFNDTYRAQNDPKLMDAHIQQWMTEEKMRADILQENSTTYFAYIDDTLAGFLKLNEKETQTEAMGSKALEVERIYILKQFQRKGLGKYLFDFVMKTAHEGNYEKVWLGVWEHNLKALSFYKQQGFSKVGEHVFKLADEEQTDYVMEKVLK